MLRRLCVVLLLLLVSPLLFVPAPALAQDEPAIRWTDNAHLWGTKAPIWEPYPTVEHMDLWIIKDADASQPGKRVKTSTMFLELWGPDVPNRVILLSGWRIPVPGDPDTASFSRDLGWAGLDTVVSVPDKTTGEMMTVELHISWWAMSGTIDQSQPGDPGYRRDARVDGTVTVHGSRGFTVRLPGDYQTYVSTYIFSTREPRPRY